MTRPIGPAAVALRRRREGLSAAGAGQRGGGLPQVFHPANAEAAQPNGLADWTTDAHLAAWLAAAPLLWVEARLGSGSAETDFAFGGYLARAVSGDTWLEVKQRLVGARTPFPEDFRWRCVEDLVLATAVLEQANIIHGDLSPNNIVVDLDAAPTSLRST